MKKRIPKQVNTKTTGKGRKVFVVELRLTVTNIVGNRVPVHRGILRTSFEENQAHRGLTKLRTLLKENGWKEA